MGQWFAENGGTVIVCLALLALVAGAAAKLIRDRRRGKSSCGCDCGCCPLSGDCHKKE